MPAQFQHFTTMPFFFSTQPDEDEPKESVKASNLPKGPRSQTCDPSKQAGPEEPVPKS